jgi:thermitase
MVAGLVRLVAPGARILPVKAFDGYGRSTVFQVVQSIYFAIDQGANIVTMSFGFPFHSFELMRAVSEATERGLICIASAGNDGVRTVRYPAAYSNVMGVASTDFNDKLSPFTNYGDALVSLAAPGEAVLAPFPGGQYALGWGSSFSAPVVAGAAALLRRLDTNAGQATAAAVLSRAKPLSGGYGWGRLLLYEALERAERIQ